MSSLTTFSKVLIVIALLTVVSLLVVMCYNCTQPNQHNSSSSYQSSPVQDYGNHQVITQPGGSQVVVVRDNSGSEFFMDYLMFQSLMNMTGGMSNVYGYRDQHRYDPTWDRDQSYYKNTSKTVVNNYYGTQVDDTKPFSEQVKQQIEYRKSNGFSKPNIDPASQPSRVESTKSNGFSEKWHSPNVETNTTEPKYTPSSGFQKSGSTSTPTYSPSKGFGSSSNNSTYKPSSGFGTSKSNSTYKPSSGFKSNNSSRSSSSPSKGFGKKN